MKLVVVESPNKCKKIREYLGPGYEVVATVGHFRDLPDRELGVDVATMTPSYIVKGDKEEVVKKLRARAKQASEVILATDADREGEAISWHVAQTLGLRSPRRMRFLEITPAALKKAVASAGPIDGHLVDAQQARRVVDRLVGYLVSPLLRPLGDNHSAGRVQTATLHIVVQREAAREAFKADVFWTLRAHYKAGFSARFARPNQKGELAEAKLVTEEEARRIAAAAGVQHVIRAVREQTLEQRPKPPFTTSTLQQAASAQLGLKPADAMRLAQGLFEAGCITYHRTDSVALSDEAVAMAREFIALERRDLLPASPPRYRASGDAQGAHEAIRPTSLDPSLDVPAEGRALFDLVRRRFLASQCKPALIAQQIVTLVAGETQWLAKGSLEAFDGHRFYLKADEDDEKEKDEDDAQQLPPLAVGDQQSVERVDVKRGETKPPPRFTQATLIKEMERLGIGRPSTFAATLKTLFDRQYLEEQKKAVAPSMRGRLVDAALSKSFTSLVEASYTAELEARLDDIAEGKRRWKDELQLWFQSFEPQLRSAPPLIATFAAAAPATSSRGKPCPKCGSQLVLRRSAHGPFLGCSAYPGCRHLEAAPNEPMNNRRSATKKEKKNAKGKS